VATPFFSATSASSGLLESDVGFRLLISKNNNKKPPKNKIKCGRHLLTNKFLSVNVRRTAELEPNAVTVMLQEHSDRSCFFKIMPRYG
jgi:hypothetical protein